MNIVAADLPGFSVRSFPNKGEQVSAEHKVFNLKEFCDASVYPNFSWITLEVDADTFMVEPSPGAFIQS